MNKVVSSIENSVFHFFKKHTRYIIVGILYLLSACSTPRYSSYIFDKMSHNDTTLQTTPFNRIEYKIQINDVLKIVVSSFNPTEDAIINEASGTPTSSEKSSGSGTGGGGNSGNEGILVDKDGCITLHRLGKFKVEGMTVTQLSKKIEIELLPYTKEPIAKVEILNHKVMIFGEVGSPVSVQMPPDQKLTIFEALNATGKITDGASIKNVMIIRDSDSGKLVSHISLEGHAIFNSPFYYLKQGDMVYLSPDREKSRIIERNQNKAFAFQSIGIVMSSITFLIFIYDRFKL